jgi:hypothetical protein
LAKPVYRDPGRGIGKCGEGVLVQEVSEMQVARIKEPDYLLVIHPVTPG